MIPRPSSVLSIFLNGLQVAAFLAVLSLPTVDYLFKIDKTRPLDEKRVLAPMPEWAWENTFLESAPEKYEAYFNDHFGFRDRLIRWYAHFKVSALGVSPRPESVTLGKNGWMFYTPDLLEPMPPGLTFDTAHLEELKVYFEDWQRRMKERGIAYLLVIAPDKKDVYGDYLPPLYRNKVKSGWQIDVVADYLRTHTTIPVVLLSETLRADSSGEPLYFKTGTHWNKLGAFLASEAIVFEARRLVPTIPLPISLGRCTVSRLSPAPGDDLATMLGLEHEVMEPFGRDVTLPGGFHSQLVSDPFVVPARFAQPHRPVVVMEHTNTSLPRAVVFRDSFATDLIPYLSEYFSRSVYYWQHPGQDDILDHEKPDIVIHEIVAREARIFQTAGDAKW